MVCPAGKDEEQVREAIQVNDHFVVKVFVVRCFDGDAFRAAAYGSGQVERCGVRRPPGENKMCERG